MGLNIKLYKERLNWRGRVKMVKQEDPDLVSSLEYSQLSNYSEYPRNQSESVRIKTASLQVAKRSPFGKQEGAKVHLGDIAVDEVVWREPAYGGYQKVSEAVERKI